MLSPKEWVGRKEVKDWSGPMTTEEGQDDKKNPATDTELEPLAWEEKWEKGRS